MAVGFARSSGCGWPGGESRPHSLSPGTDHGPLVADALRILVRAPPPLFLPDGEASAAYQRGVGGPR